MKIGFYELFLMISLLIAYVSKWNVATCVLVGSAAILLLTKTIKEIVKYGKTNNSK